MQGLTQIRYANKLIAQKGLALSIYDILTAEDGRVTWGNGLMYYKGEILGCSRTDSFISADNYKFHFG